MKIEDLKQPTIYFPIGPSGSGKSTVYNKLKSKNPNLNVFSLDILRHEFYDKDNYAKAWKMSTEDEEFSNKANKRFFDELNKRKDLYIDNTNLSPKSRKFYLDHAKKKGYRTVAIVFNVDIETLVKRQTTRTDKSVPEEAVRRQHASMVLPQQSEFDIVINAEEV